eukprot:CAMPEP_0197028246 /NCGR_PEP_ID=MMETSP1384-20130603/7975_1 /TAXON_ID=29189 /ORGANISM="Ammonia sp." /LENGTH=838 /DNA_ID=CAMNT_0042457217 /DNA_START=21 /DNA_END=2534 /DNA_ORIENTATION=+
MAAQPKSTYKRKSLYPRLNTGNVAFVGTFRAFSMAVLGRSSLEIGDKIILPQQTLQSINRLRLPFPLIFEVRKYDKLSSSQSLTQREVVNKYKRRIENIYRSTNPTKISKIDKWLKKHESNPHQLYVRICKVYGILPKARIVSNGGQKYKQKKGKSFGKQYCSVYEFSSPQQDSAYLPHWMMQNLGVEEGEKIELQSQFNIQKATYCKLQPFKQEFMDKVSSIGYKSTLEHSLRHYSVLSVNQRIVVEFNHFPYECIVKQTKPHSVVSILGSTDLEIEFEEPLINGNSYQIEPQFEDLDIDSVLAPDPNDNNNNSNDICVDSASSSASSLSDIDVVDADMNGTVKPSDIDGTLLKKLGVPLDYNEQTDLATMILENRKLNEENKQRLNAQQTDKAERDSDDDEEVQQDQEDKEQEEEEEKRETISDERLSPIGPNDVQCQNCGKYVHKMSIQMHEVHCIRENITCKLCKKCIKKQAESEHVEEYHREFTCICNQLCVGALKYNEHKAKTCKLRLVTCEYCGCSDITAERIKAHKQKCGEQSIVCNVCQKTYVSKNKAYHNCGVVCILCGERIEDSKDKLLHLVTVCPERRAICNYCGTFRKCGDMEQHRKFCGSRSEKCETCNQFVSLMNMEPHLQSNCQWFSNKQLSSNSNSKRSKESEVHDELEALDLNNPYLDAQLFGNENANTDNNHNNDNANGNDSLFGLLKSNPMPTRVDTTSFAVDAMSSSLNDRQLCPHCVEDDTLLTQEEFETHIALKHPDLIDATLTQSIMASFSNPDIVQYPNDDHRKAGQIPKKKATAVSKQKKKRVAVERKRANSEGSKDKYGSYGLVKPKTEKW